jgi:hypothetical protein
MSDVLRFRISGLPRQAFAPFFGLGDSELARRGARRYVADHKPGFPCRVSLRDAEPGEQVILLAYAHHDVASPYRAAGPIFVREQAEQAALKVNEVPEVVRHRLLSIRAYDAAGFMNGAEVVEGQGLEDQIRRFFADAAVAYLHVHNARPGCYSCRVDRAEVPLEGG